MHLASGTRHGRFGNINETYAGRGCPHVKRVLFGKNNKANMQPKSMQEEGVTAVTHAEGFTVATQKHDQTRKRWVTAATR